MGDEMNVYVLGTSPSARDGNLGDVVADRFEEKGHDVLRDHGWHPDAGRFMPPAPQQLKDSSVLVVTSGLAWIEPFDEVDEMMLRELITANLALPLVTAHRYVQARGRKGGTVVLVGSYAHDHVLSNSVGYCAAKAGLDMAVRSMAWDLRATTFSIKVVHPYHIADTPMARYVEQRVTETKGLGEREAKLYATKDLGVEDPLHVEEVAELITEMTSDINRFQTRMELYGPAR